MFVPTRRSILRTAAGSALAGLLANRSQAAEKPPIAGFEKSATQPSSKKIWQPVSDRKLRVGLIGYGVCQFSALFSFQDHPSVEVVAVSDLISERCAALAKTVRCAKTYPSIEELVKDEKVEAVFIATDAPSHARHAQLALAHGKHVGSAVPAVYGSLEDAEELFEAVKRSGLVYMMFETSAFHEDLYAMRQIFDAGGFGKLTYSEGEYFHFMPTPIDSFKGWRIGLPPQWYPTHSNAYYVAVSRGLFTEVSCQGITSTVPHLLPENNAYKNAFGTEIALFRTSEGGTSRMAVSWDTPGVGGEVGRVRGQKGSFYGKFEGLTTSLPDLTMPALPPGVAAGFHGGSHGYLCDEFVSAVLRNRRPLISVAEALNMTVGGIVAHQSALKDGELLKIPAYHLA